MSSDHCSAGTQSENPDVTSQISIQMLRKFDLKKKNKLWRIHNRYPNISHFANGGESSNPGSFLTSRFWSYSTIWQAVLMRHTGRFSHVGVSEFLYNSF